MYEQNQNHEPAPMSDTARYFNDIHHLTGRSVGAMYIAIDKFIVANDISSVSIDSLIKAGCEFIPTEYELEHDSRIAKEKLCLLPLEYLGVEIEGSSRSVEEIGEWYSGVIGYMQREVGDTHGDICLEEGNQRHMMCSSSTICPYRYVEQTMSRAIMTPDFDSLDYMIDPKRTYEIARRKLIVAAYRDIYSIGDARRLETQYVMKYRTRFRD